LLRAQVGTYVPADLGSPVAAAAAAAASAGPKGALADANDEFVAFLLHLSQFIALHSPSPRMLVLPLSRAVANVLVGYFVAAVVALTSFIVRLAFDGAA